MQHAPLPHRIDIENVIANSFKDFHTKGFDYLCVKRSPTETLKLYFFDGDVTKLPEVVNPHDHRYDFDTWILAGAAENVWFGEQPNGRVYQRFDYRTPLNGGDGFTHAGEIRLRETARVRRQTGGHYWMGAKELHTIRIVENETVLMLRQFEDMVPLDRPTQTFTRGPAPELGGLYSRFTADEVVAKLSNLEARLGVPIAIDRRAA